MALSAEISPITLEISILGERCWWPEAEAPSLGVSPLFPSGSPPLPPQRRGKGRAAPPAPPLQAQPRLPSRSPLARTGSRRSGAPGHGAFCTGDAGEEGERLRSLQHPQFQVRKDSVTLNKLQ